MFLMYLVGSLTVSTIEVVSCSQFFISLDPFILTHEQVDKGAIRFVLSGANIMCPGLTSPGAKMIDAPAETIVVSFSMIKQNWNHFDIHSTFLLLKF